MNCGYCACGAVRILSIGEVVTRDGVHNHSERMCDVGKPSKEKSETTMTDAHGNRWVPEDKSTATLEQKSYRAGWDAGSRQADSRLAELKQDNSRLQALYQGMVTKHCGAGDEDEDDETEGDKLTIEKLGDKLTIEKLRQSLANAHRLVSKYQLENANLKHGIESMMAQRAAEPPLTDDDKHWLKQRADRAATKALLDKPYWAEGIDPDEP